MLVGRWYKTHLRRFECFTADLHWLADWLQSCGVKTVALQSTGVYWIPLYVILEERRFEVYLVNARYTKNLPGPQESRRASPLVRAPRLFSPSSLKARLSVSFRSTSPVIMRL
jgi:hypothetical protein